MAWRLDVVTLLAVIGESSIADHSQTITASALCLLPRIIPAPQALLKPSRPVRLPEVKAKMTGVYSGVVLDSVGFFANIIHPLDELPAFAFKVLEITHTDMNTAGDVELGQRVTTNGRPLLSRLRTGQTATALSQPRSAKSVRIPGPPPDAELAPAEAQPRTSAISRASRRDGEDPQPGIKRRHTVKERVQDFVANPTLANTQERPAIPATLLSPVHILAVFSLCLTLGIIAVAAVVKDATAIVAVSLIAIQSSVVGLASWWRPVLMKRSHTNKVPDGDVVIRTREGAFLVIKCTEEVARELYYGTDECDYHVGPLTYRALMGIGTFLLMVTVILLGNCKWWSQVFIAASYILLNGLYWLLGMLPKKLFWDLSRYEVRDITPDYAQGAHGETDPSDQREGVKSFTRTLWWAIRETKRTAWVEKNGAAPITPQWREWLAEAEHAAKNNNIKWPSVARKDEIMKRSSEEARSPVSVVTETRRDFDAAEQRAPAAEVQPASQEQAAGLF
ncbi:uncharacterized protein B0I36DRAFT_246508 [Microdochium trichocladiopsis]|uniref:Uncharacterized protein n=1 Tax=Microdochium trichocladiopsis TaxID=1682393 RepID=A0A9P9BP06_9PEZI|nr:uncharacterized protein B0I36DRAFT_246508 [Microdochium trichocladiopsis]KAH7028029.1 hypothetical protein B0I36DRAFT_246508 [Microdochium trichocladiopsis]